MSNDVKQILISSTCQPPWDTPTVKPSSIPAPSVESRIKLQNQDIVIFYYYPFYVYFENLLSPRLRSLLSSGIRARVYIGAWNAIFYDPTPVSIVSLGKSLNFYGNSGSSARPFGPIIGLGCREWIHVRRASGFGDICMAFRAGFGGVTWILWIDLLATGRFGRWKYERLLWVIKCYGIWLKSAFKRIK